MADERPQSSHDRFDELERVVLTEDVSAYDLQAGDIGTVVHVYEGHRGYEVEFCTLAGETIGVVTLSPNQVRRAVGAEVAHARRLAG